MAYTAIWKTQWMNYKNIFKLTETFIFYMWFCEHFNLYIGSGWHILKVCFFKLSFQCSILFKSVVFKQRGCEKQAFLHILSRVNTGRSKICFGFHSLRVSSYSHRHPNNFGNSAISIESKFFHVNQISWACILYMFISLTEFFSNPNNLEKWYIIGILFQYVQKMILSVCWLE